MSVYPAPLVNQVLDCECLDKHVALLRQHLRSLGYTGCSQLALNASDNTEGFVAAKEGDSIDRNGVHNASKQRAGAVNVTIGILQNTRFSLYSICASRRGF
jgi:hypothetical protein